MKFEEAMEIGREAIEQINEEQRNALEEKREAAAAEQSMKEKRDEEDAVLFAAMKKQREKKQEQRLPVEDPDVYVRIVGRQNQTVRVDVKPVNEVQRPYVTIDFLFGAMTALVAVGVVTFIVCKLLRIV